MRKETKEQISRRMSLIRSKWTKPERMLHGMLKSLHVRHKMHPKMHPKELGHPDALLSGTKVVLFAHGCFWHDCPECKRDKARMTEFWRNKIERNAARDARQLAALVEKGWEPVVIWEHDFDNGRYRKVVRWLACRHTHNHGG